MAGVDFPNSPTLNQIFTAPNNASYAWDGVKWMGVVGGSGSGGSISDAPNTGSSYVRNNGAWSTALVGDSVTSTGSTTARQLADRFAEVANVSDFGGSVQAAHDSLPATGGVVLLAANTVYSVSTEIEISKSNVIVRGMGWGTILRRVVGTLSTSSSVINVTGAGCVVEDLTVDGAATTFDGGGHSELRMTSPNGLIDNCQVINGGGAIHVTLAGESACIRNSTITGLAMAPPTETNYGIWAINGNSVKIINNTITGTGIDAIGFDGAGSIVSGNKASNCHWYVADGGGQIAAYSTATGGIICNNWVGPGGAVAAGGIDSDGDNMVITGNEIVGVQGNGIGINTHASQLLISGNLIKNTGNGGVVFIGINVAAGVSDFQIINNRIFDDQVTKTMHWAVAVQAGASNRYVIQGNVLAPTFTGAISDAGTGTDKIISDNVGVDDVIATVASAATVTFPLNSTISLTGTTGITAIAAAGSWIGRKLTIIPTGVLTITAGATIANTITTVANVPMQAVFDGTLWHFQTPLNSANAVITNTLQVGADTGGNANIILDTARSNTRYFDFRSASNTIWRLQTANSEPGTGNTGGDLQLQAFNDSNALLSTVLTWTRSTQAMAVGASISCGPGTIQVNQGNAGFTVGSAGPTIRSGTGAAAGTQPAGSLFLRTDGTAGARVYVSAGAGTWTPIATV